MKNGPNIKFKTVKKFGVMVFCIFNPLVIFWSSGLLFFGSSGFSLLDQLNKKYSILFFNSKFFIASKAKLELGRAQIDETVLCQSLHSKLSPDLCGLYVIFLSILMCLYFVSVFPCESVFYAFLFHGLCSHQSFDFFNFDPSLSAPVMSQD